MYLENVSFSYPGKPVFENLTFELPDAGVTAISGPSGCGKTTLLRLIAGLEKPQSGRVHAPGLTKTSFLFQEDRLLPNLTCREQLRAVLPRGAEVSQYMDAVGLSNAPDSKPDTLSGGMRRRLALARAFAYAKDKSLLILDEPFTGVDPPTAEKIMSSLRTLPLPILLTAHDSESLSLADTVLPFQKITGKS